MKLVNCPICGKRCSAESNICPNCGFEIQNYFKDRANSHKKISRKAKKLFSFLGIVLIILLLSVFIIATIMKGNFTLPSEDNFESKDIIEESDIPASEESTLVNATDAENNIEEKFSGVYSGDDHEILVLDNNGLAYYYCTSIEYTELQCPWYIKEDFIYIDFSRLHCTVFAEVNDKELLFKSDSANWNAELFTKLDVSIDDYLTRGLSTYDSSATLNIDGTITYSLDNISYTLPKSFLDLKDEYDNIDYCSMFVEIDHQTNYLATALFYSEDGEPLSEDSASNTISRFASRFIDDATLGTCTPTIIANQQAYICEVSGYLNEGFSALRDYAFSGYIAVLYNEITGNTNYILLMQSSSRSIDNSENFIEILSNAK